MTGGPVIEVGTAPRSADFSALWVDGSSAEVTAARVHCDDERRQLRILPEGQAEQTWPYDDLRQLPDQAGDDSMIVHLAEGVPARLILGDAEAVRLVTARGGFLDRRESHVRKRSVALWAAAALAAVWFIIAVLIPVMADRLATFLPPEGEKALGDATFEQISTALAGNDFGLAVCRAPDGLAALRKIETRLTSGVQLETELTVVVLDHPMVNAFALPGGYVVFFNGLIEEAGSPEEIAAVFAHEVGHVEARDPARIALRSAGSIGVLGLLFGDFAGGALVLFLAESIIRADYTQEAEAAADAFAHTMLLEADLPPSAIATLFETLAKTHGVEDEDTILRHFMSHPAMGDRIAASRAAEPEGFVPRPLLTEAEFEDLRRICVGASSFNGVDFR